VCVCAFVVFMSLSLCVFMFVAHGNMRDENGDRFITEEIRTFVKSQFRR